MTSTTSRSRKWCFTLNNFSVDEHSAVKAIPCRFLIFGVEEGDSGTPHLQGYIEFSKPQRLSAVKRLLPRAHLEIARGTVQENIDYCSKGGDVFRSGAPANESGQQEILRWDAARESARTGDFDAIPSDIYIRYRAALHQIWDAALWSTATNIPNISLRPWQASVVELIRESPHPRKIHFFVDIAGGAGKSTFAHYLRCAFERVQILRPGRGVDVAFAIRPARVFVFDCPRSSGDAVCWSTIESIKDGYVFSSKYEPRFKSFDVPHVLVFCNSAPPEATLSVDRLDLTYL